MSENKNNASESDVTAELKSGLKSKTGGSVVQNPDHNNESHKEALGPNTKR